MCIRDRGYNDYGSWGQVTMTITSTNGTDEQNYGKWFVYKNGVEVNVTETPENFSYTLVGQNRTYNVGGGLGFVAGEVLTFYKSQMSVNPIFFADKDLPNRNTYACLLYTSDAADERSSVDLGGRR